MKPNRIRALAYGLGGLGVVLGAFGAHGLKFILTTELLEVWQTAVFYQFVHVFLLIALAYGDNSTLSRLAVWSAVIGIVLFCGSLYLYCLLGFQSLGMITPLGGLLFIVAWLLAAIDAWRKANANQVV